MAAQVESSNRGWWLSALGLGVAMLVTLLVGGILPFIGGPLVAAIFIWGPLRAAPIRSRIAVGAVGLLVLLIHIRLYR
ncbi:hypothetical protein VV02_24725 [Luteipulveratus mongoliensis]|uniref:Uncharacterized protein n=1 Tax=Luteipulveratus mongoliensis TaxID=571913 RepID=A0A0K1JNL0_9MICO|nr:hypothetical protein VV02_24725 [Luteipulveratus mongoliensis]